MNVRPRQLAGRKRIALAIVVSVVILVILFEKTGLRLEGVVAHLQQAKLPLLAATLVFSALWHAFVGADKWWRILRAQGAPVGWWEVFRVRMGSDPIRLAAPLKLGEVVNAVYFGRLGSMGFSRAAGSIVFDKALNFFGTVFWLYLGLAVIANVPTAGHLLLHTLVAAALVALVAVHPVRRAAMAVAERIHPRLGRLARGVLSAFEEFSWRQKLGFLAYGVLFQLRPLVVCWLLFAALGPARLPSVEEVLAYGSVVVLMGNVPSLGVGPREAAMVALFAGYADSNMLAGIGLLMSFAMQFFPALLGVPLMFPLLRALSSGDAAPLPGDVPAAEAIVPPVTSTPITSTPVETGSSIR